MKFLKPILIFFGIIITIIICICLYFVTGFSYTYPPLKEYNYSISADNLGKGLINLTKLQKSISIKFTDTTGSKESGQNYYMDIKIINVDTCYEYNIKYNHRKQFWRNSPSSEIDIIGAFDKTHKTGGYKMEDKDVKRLITIFEDKITSKIEMFSR